MKKPKEEIEVRRTDVTRDHVAIYSYAYVDTKTGEVTKEYHPVVNLINGRIDCTCPHFGFTLRRKARTEGQTIDIGRPKFQCKHLHAAIRDCIEVGDIILQLKGTQTKGTQHAEQNTTTRHAGARRVEAQRS